MIVQQQYFFTTGIRSVKFTRELDGSSHGRWDLLICNSADLMTIE